MSAVFFSIKPDGPNWEWLGYEQWRECIGGRTLRLELPGSRQTSEIGHEVSWCETSGCR